MNASRSPRVALTSDDGLGEGTVLVLEVLQAEDVDATLFFVGARTRSSPVVLLHDTLPSTVAATRPMVRDPKERVFRLVTVTGLLGETTPGRRYAGRIGPRARMLRRKVKRGQFLANSGQTPHQNEGPQQRTWTVT